jgi:hypothetical protein
VGQQLAMFAGVAAHAQCVLPQPCSAWHASGCRCVLEVPQAPHHPWHSERSCLHAHVGSGPVSCQRFSHEAVCHEGTSLPGSQFPARACAASLWKQGNPPALPACSCWARPP